MGTYQGRLIVDDHVVITVKSNNVSVPLLAQSATEIKKWSCSRSGQVAQKNPEQLFLRC